MLMEKLFYYVCNISTIAGLVISVISLRKIHNIKKTSNIIMYKLNQNYVADSLNELLIELKKIRDEVFENRLEVYSPQSQSRLYATINNASSLLCVIELEKEEYACFKFSEKNYDKMHELMSKMQMCLNGDKTDAANMNELARDADVIYRVLNNKLERWTRNGIIQR